jgi:hypothetical protein
MAARAAARRVSRDQRGQAALLFLGLLGVVLTGTLVLFGFAQALGTKGKHQRAADLAAVSAAQVMRRQYSGVRHGGRGAHHRRSGASWVCGPGRARVSRVEHVD